MQSRAERDLQSTRQPAGMTVARLTVAAHFE